MPRHFAKIQHNHWTPKNKLEQDWQAHCKQIERAILEDDDHKAAFVFALHKKLEILNQQHSRCKPLNWSVLSPMKNESVEFVGVNYVCTIGIWQEREEASHE